MTAVRKLTVRSVQIPISQLFGGNGGRGISEVGFQGTDVGSIETAQPIHGHSAVAAVIFENSYVLGAN